MHFPRLLKEKTGTTDNDNNNTFYFFQNHFHLIHSTNYQISAKTQTLYQAPD